MLKKFKHISFIFVLFSLTNVFAGTEVIKEYNTETDSAKIFAKPALPTLGKAGFVFKDPVFGCRITSCYG